MGWKNNFGTGSGADTITSGIEGAWTDTPTQWSNKFFENLYGYEWEVHKGPGGAWQWKPKDGAGAGTFPDAHDASKKHAPFMLTTDLSLRFDPEYAKISKHFLENPQEFADAYSQAWFKLTHRDMGPKVRYMGPEVPAEELIWQDPLPAADYGQINDQDVEHLKGELLKSGLSISQLVATAWASASTFRGSDNRGGANGARVRLAPQKDWDVNNPSQLSEALGAIEKIQADFNNAQSGDKKVSIADLIVLGGCAAIEQAANDAGHNITVPFAAGRVDALAEHTDAESFDALEPVADGFRNYNKGISYAKAEELLIDKAQLLTLTVPEMTVLVGGLRALNANYDQSHKGIFTDRAGQLTNDFFVNVLDLGIKWSAQDDSDEVFVGKDRSTDEFKWTGSRVDLIFGSNSELRAIAEVYASSDAEDKFVADFVAAWTKVMNLDRFEIA